MSNYPTIPDTIVQRYLEPHRRYHTLEHIFQAQATFFIQFAHSYGSQFNQDLWEAIWYHDAVYELGAKDNELKSALLAREYGCSTIVEGLILCTIYPAQERVYTEAEAVIMDVDLSGLGAPPILFDHNSQNVKEEYLTKFTEQEWKVGRPKFLQMMVDQPTIFHTKRGKEIWEFKARENIRRELSKMS